MKTVVFTGGGTGGHIYPGLAVVDGLKEKINSTKIDGTSLDVKIVWIGSSKGMDKNLVEKSGSVDKFIGIPCGKLRRYFSFQNFIDLFKIAAGFISAFFHLAKLKPLVVFSKGGFVSVPSCYAAKLLKIPVFTHECDFSTGLATRLNLKVAEKLLVSYEETKNKLPSSVQEKTIVTGNPVRGEILTADKETAREELGLSDKPYVLVFGGSLGAQKINDTMLGVIPKLKERGDIKLLFGTGERNFDTVHSAVKAMGIDDNDKTIEITPYIDNMAEVMAAAGQTEHLTEAETAAADTAEARTTDPAVSRPSTGNRSSARAGAGRIFFRSRRSFPFFFYCSEA
jgi:UDP-N-acetylglucosamine--N-acetylmuramyl-(pentapeptide) pyrophosphoryl-undecaprenol N-acetylglucosamine transferase